MGQLKSQISVPRSAVAKVAIVLMTGLGLSISQPSKVSAQDAPPSSLQSIITIPVPPPESNASGLCPGDLQAAIASIVENPRFSDARWGILIQPVAESTVLYQHNPETALIPASNVKLLTTAAAIRIASDRATALEPWIAEVNRYSDNDQADALLRRIGGQTAIRNALELMGVHANTYAQVDGSGLSRSNRATPTALVNILKGMYTDPHSRLFYDSLAVAGVNGTLRNRFRGTPVQGRLHAKTGTLTGVRALSGYLETQHYGTIAFSIVVNQPGQSGQVMTRAIDQIVLRLFQVARCN